MSIIPSSVGRDPSHTGDIPVSTQGTYRVRYNVVSDDPDDGPVVIYNYFVANGLPVLNSTYSFGNDTDVTSVLQSFKPTKVDESDPAAVCWKVDLEFSPLSEQENGENESGQPESNPLQWRDRLEVFLVERTVDQWEATFDGVQRGIPGQVGDPKAMPYDGGPNSHVKAIGSRGLVTNSQGTAFDPPLQVRKTDTGIRLTVTYLEFDNAWPGYVNTVNDKAVKLSNTFYGVDFQFPKWTMKVANIGGAFRFVNNQRFWEMQFEYHNRPETYVQLIADRGMGTGGLAGAPDGHGGVIESALDNAVPTVIRAREPQGDQKPDRLPLAEPINLDGSGFALQTNDLALTYWLRYLAEQESAHEALPGITLP